MSKKNEFLVRVGFYLLVGGLLAYAASRTLHFVNNLMPDSIYGYLFLLATSAGAIIWLGVYLVLAKGSKQRGLSFAMGLVDLFGELVLVYADTIFVGNKAGLVKMSDQDMRTFVIVSVAAVGINVLAGYMFHLWDLKAEQSQQTQDLVDHVTDETIKAMQTPEAKQAMVTNLLPVLQSAIAAEVSDEIMRRAGVSGGMNAQALGWPMPGQGVLSNKAPAVNESFFDKVRGLLQPKSKEQNDAVVWTTDSEGNRRRVMCMRCYHAGKPWLTPEPCEHILNAKGESGDLNYVKSALNDSLGSGEKS